MKRGSITPFCALSLLLVAAFLFVLLESTRVYGLERFAALKAEAAVDSVCGEYQPYLWQEYGLLFLDGAYGTTNFSMAYVIESLESYMELNENTADLFQLTRGEVLLEGYALATDEEGELFLSYVAERQKESLPMAVAVDLYHDYQNAQKVYERQEETDEAVELAEETIKEAKTEWIAREEQAKEEKKKEGKEVEEEIWVPDTSSVDTILSNAKKMQSSGILNQIFEELSVVSAQSSMPFDRLSGREKETGTMYFTGTGDWYRKLLVLDYLEDHFANYTSPKEGHMLQYEMEYVIGGKNTEWENLENVLGKILLIREAANMISILQDQEKTAWIAETAAAVGVLAGENPIAVKAVEVGIMSAWAYMESVLDVRTLVSGGVIPLIKQKEEWTTNSDQIFTVFDKQAKAKECKNGMDYTAYLKQLLFLMENKELAYRMMEVMEIGMRQQEAYANCRMDYMLVMQKFQVCFESRPVFSSLVSIGKPFAGTYRFKREIERSYLP